jgi:hypothetical protein
MRLLRNKAGSSWEGNKISRPDFLRRGCDIPRILVTGGAGYVGSHVAKALSSAGHEAIVFDNLSRGRRELVRWGALIIGDVRDRAALDEVFRRQKIDAVVHLAALAYVEESTINPDAYYDVNVNGASEKNQRDDKQQRDASFVGHLDESICKRQNHETEPSFGWLAQTNPQPADIQRAHIERGRRS